MPKPLITFFLICSLFHSLNLAQKLPRLSPMFKDFVSLKELYKINKRKPMNS
jgi:hypothetical protein